MKTPLRTLPLLAVATLLACSGSSGGIKTAADFAAALDAVMVSKLTACRPGTAAYEDLLVKIVLGTDPARIAANANVGYDAAAGSRCLDGLSSLTCAQLDAAPLSADCFLAFQGKVPAGGTCVMAKGFDCASGICTFNSAACDQPGTCAATGNVGDACTSTACRSGLSCTSGICTDPKTPVPPVAPAGGSCATAVCPDTQYCDTASSICTDRLADGGSCASDTQCRIGSKCSPSSVCTHVPVVGDACTVGTYGCPIGAYCSAAGRCTSDPGIGGACGALSGSDPVYCIEGWCDTGTGTTGTCAAFEALGASCSATAPYQCGLYAGCDATSSTCVPNYCGPVM